MTPLQRAAQAKKIVEDWNSKHPPGTRVTRYKLMAPLREGHPTTTITEAWVMGGHSAMVMCQGIGGGVAVESLVPEVAK